MNYAAGENNHDRYEKRNGTRLAEGFRFTLREALASRNARICIE